MVFLKAAVNGGRARGAHPALPVTPEELARDAKAVVKAGAHAIHVHPRDASGRETMSKVQHAASIAALRAAVPKVPIGATTIASIEPDPRRRIELVRKWSEKPDFVSVNWNEEGSAALAAAMVESGIGVEVSLWTIDDARQFVDSGFAAHSLRILVSPQDANASPALTTAAAVVDIVRPTGLPLVVFGHDRTTWPLVRWAIAHGHGTRIGLEDTLTLEGGKLAKDNAELVAAAVGLAR